MATDRAVAAGIGRGELSAWMNNLRALVVAVGPVWCERNACFVHSLKSSIPDAMPSVSILSTASSILVHDARI